MQALKARVLNGRLVLNEPTDLPEGEVVELVEIERVLADGGDDLDDEDRAALDRELTASIEEDRDETRVDAFAVIAELRSLR
jgi:hypothetical protein